MPAHTTAATDATRRRDAANAIRLSCLGPDVSAFAAKTFRLHPSDIVAATSLLAQWPASRESLTTED